jgi:hypothetical protein
MNEMTVAAVESDLLVPLLQWLRTRRQVRNGSVLVQEFPWYGRWVDLALLTASGNTAAFELKLAHNRRAIEQSYLNGVSFDRSYFVTATRPSQRNFVQAASLGVGVVHISLGTGSVSLLSPPRRAAIHPRLRTKLQQALVQRRGTDV